MSFWNKLNDNFLGIFGKNATIIEEKELTVKKETTEPIEIAEKKVIKEEKVVFISELDKLKKQLPNTFNKVSSMDEYWTAIIALEAVGASCASSDKDFSNKERKEINKFIPSINESIPSSVKEKIEELHQSPLPFNKAFLLAKESKLEMSVFEELIDLIVDVDGVKFEEKVVINAWHDFKKSA